MTINYSSYLDSVVRELWAWADEHHPAELDGGKRQNRSPVLATEFSSLGVLVPQDASIARAIRAAIPKSKRHRWFRSLKSSQALTQSIFGAVDVLNCLDLLQDVQAECGRPAFFEQGSGLEMEFEHEVDWLAEPQPTSIDVLLGGPRGVSPSNASSRRESSAPVRVRTNPLVPNNIATETMRYRAVDVSVAL